MRPNRQKKEDMQAYVMRRVREMKAEDAKSGPVRPKEVRVSAAFEEWREKNKVGPVHTTYASDVARKEPPKKAAKERRKKTEE